MSKDQGGESYINLAIGVMVLIVLVFLIIFLARSI